MPAQNSQLETTTPPPPFPPPPPEEAKADDSVQASENHHQEQADNECDSDGSACSSDGKKDEVIVVKLAEIRKEVQCPICLGIIRKTRTVMECLHRFCRECIDKSMRLGNNECPACRTHCASRRSLRDDPNYDALIAVLYPDIDKYEEEELAFNDEEKARNKQIQYLIAQTLRRQTEEMGKKRISARTTAVAYARRHGNYRNLRGRKSHRVIEHQESDEDEEGNGHYGSKDSSSADEHSVEIKSKRYKRSGGARTSQPSSEANADGGCDDNYSEAKRELVGGGIQILAWGRGAMRSSNRHGDVNTPNGKFSKNNRISKLVGHLQSSSENDLVLNISLTLVSLNEENIPSLKRPYLSCSPASSVKHLCQYIAMQTSVEASEIEMMIIKNSHPVNNSSRQPSMLNPCNSELQMLNEHQTVGEIHPHFTQQNLVLAYRKKTQD